MKTAAELRIIVNNKREEEIAEINRKAEEFLENSVMPQLIAQAERGCGQVFFPIGAFKLGLAIEISVMRILRDNGFEVKDTPERKWRISW